MSNTCWSSLQLACLHPNITSWIQGQVIFFDKVSNTIYFATLPSTINHLTSVLVSFASIAPLDHFILYIFRKFDQVGHALKVNDNCGWMPEGNNVFPLCV